MVFEERVDHTPIHTKTDNEDMFRTKDQPNEADISASDIINEALDETEEFYPKSSDHRKSRKHPSQTVKRQMWSNGEKEKIRSLF